MEVCARSASGGRADFDFRSAGVSGEFFRKNDVTLCGILGVERKEKKNEGEERRKKRSAVESFYYGAAENNDIFFFFPW